MDAVVDYRRALDEAADHLRRLAAEAGSEPALLAQCPDRAGLVRQPPYPVPALDPGPR